MLPLDVTADVLERLLDSSDAALRAKVLVDLLDRPADDPDVVAARSATSEQPWVRATLAAHHGDGTWGRGFYEKYRGTSWVLLHLSEVGAPMDVDPVQRGVERLVEAARSVQDIPGERGFPFRDLADGAYWHYPIACLTAHMALVLIRAGWAEHPVTRSALEACRHRFEPGRGFGCFVMNDSLLPACVMTVPKVLKAFLALPRELRTRDDEAAIVGMVETLTRFRLHAYVPAATSAWNAWSKEATAARRRDAKRAWIAAGRLEPRAPKEGWTRFSFPHGYDSDLLEVLLLLGEAGTPRDDAIDGGLEIVRSKRGSDGMWKLVGGPNGRMHARLDAAGRPSPWMTYRALLAFKRFGLLAPVPAACGAAGRGVGA
jgi:hypothetical protein